MRFKARTIATGATLAQLWNFQNLTQGGGPNPKREKKHYSVIHHFQGVGKAKINNSLTITRQNILFTVGNILKSDCFLLV